MGEQDSGKSNGAANAAAGVDTSTAALIDLIDELLPRGGGKIHDVFGNEYDVPAALPARAELRGARALYDLWNLPQTRAVLTEAGVVRERGGDAAALVWLLGALADDADVADALHAVFAGFHGGFRRKTAGGGQNEFIAGLLDDAQARAQQAWRERGLNHLDAPTNVLDLFSTEAVVAAVAPFLKAGIRGATAALRAMPGATSSLTSLETPSAPSSES